MPSDPTALANHVLNELLGRGLRSLSEFEEALHQWAMALCLLVMAELFVRLDRIVADRAQGGGALYKGMHGHRCICRFGSFRYERTMFQAVRNGAVWSPLGEHLGLKLGFVTPLAARLSVRTGAGLSTRAATKLLAEFGEVAPSRTTLMKLILHFGDAVEESRSDVLALMAREAGPSDDAVAVSVQLDGVMIQMVGGRRAELREKALEEGRKAGGPIGKEEASVGALAFYDAEGERVGTLRVARVPEREKASLKSDLRSLLAAVLAHRPDLTVCVGSDGAPNHWTFLESLDPDYQSVDFYHTMEHIQTRLNKALGVGTTANQKLATEWRTMLAEGEHAKVFSALEAVERKAGTFKPRKTAGRGAQPTYYERHNGRMAYADLRALKLPIGTGVIEGTARYAVVDRMRQTGMRWKRPGGQSVLDLRCAVINGVYPQIWEMLFPERPILDVLTAA